MEEFLTDAGIHLLDDEAVLIDNKFYIVGRRDASRCEKVEAPEPLHPSLPNRWIRTNQLFLLTISQKN